MSGNRNIFWCKNAQTLNLVSYMKMKHLAAFRAGFEVSRWPLNKVTQTSGLWSKHYYLYFSWRKKFTQFGNRTLDTSGDLVHLLCNTFSKGQLSVTTYAQFHRQWLSLGVMMTSVKKLRTLSVWRIQGHIADIWWPLFLNSVRENILFTSSAHITMLHPFVNAWCFSFWHGPPWE